MTRQNLRDAVQSVLARVQVPVPGTGTPPEIARTIDHTLLRPDASVADVEALCDEAREFGFASVCVNPVHVRVAAARLAGSPVHAGTVVGFPLGADLPRVKALEAREALAEGAEEIDMVQNLGALKAGNFDQMVEEIREVAEVCHTGGALLKVILETAMLGDQETVASCLLAREGGADFVKTSTGFATAGATIRDIALMKAAVDGALGIKASGGIRTLAQARAMIEAGATRLGTSTGVRIVRESRA
jgi:deoxyribose-phosphate aldolase